MKVEVQIDPALDQPVIVLRAPMPTAEVEELARRLRAEAVPQPFTVYTPWAVWQNTPLSSA